MTRADRIVIGILALVTVALWPLASAAATDDADRVTITCPAGETVVSLAEDAEYEIAGATGSVTVRIESGAVSVTESGCPDQTCVRTGAVTAAGSVIACVPNRVIVRVGGADRDGLDARIR
ncbi:MAG: NusG domain II-containing protein [Coriobacteriia bacterium]|nr:NusG domain II-containing protein [Coriobacteriia bacterium]